MRLFPTSCLATILLASPSISTAADLETCLQREPVEWRVCLESLDREVLAADPDTALSFLERLESRIRLDAPSILDDGVFRADFLDRKAEAYGLLGEMSRSAESALLALEADSGTRVLEWWSVGGEHEWTAVLDTTGRRHARAARALLELEREAEARALLAGALRLGAVGDAATLWTVSGGGPVEGFDAKPEPLRATPWFPVLPRAQVQLVEGEPLVLEDARGSVLILDFWASWCEPCLKELPALGRLYESEKQHGLEVLLINMREAPEHALRFARGLGLKMPVGIYDEALEDAFGAETLPTVIVVDRDGRIRARWDGYVEGIEDEVAALARELLGPDAYDPGERVGQVLLGGSRLHVVWARTAKGGVDSLVVLRPHNDGASGRLVALAGRQLLSYDRRGVVTDAVARPPGSGLLRRGDLDGEGREALFSFRTGGTRIARLDPEQGKHDTWESPAPLLDLEVVPPQDGNSGAIFLATVSGLQRRTVSGETKTVQAIPDPVALAVFASPGGRHLAVISRDRGLCTLGFAETVSEACSGGEGWQVVAGPPGSGLGVVPRGVVAVTGRILGGESGEVALITTTSQLLILDITSGRELYRARLPGLRAIAAGDLDGDGVDELALAVEDHILLLGAVPQSIRRDTGIGGDRSFQW